MVPVMLGGLILGGKSYTFMEYVQVLMITLGVCIFNFGGSKKGSDASDSFYGLALIAFSLFMDAVTGGLQDRVRPQFNVHLATSQRMAAMLTCRRS